MTGGRRSTFALLASLAAPGALAAPPAEPLVVTRLPDPDPSFVPPKPETKAAQRPHRMSEENPTLDQAMESLGRVTGQLAKVSAQNARSNPQWEAEARERLRKLREQAEAPKN